MIVIKAYSLHPLQNPRYNSYHTNKFDGVEHRKKSLDYRLLMYDVNQCEVISPLILMSAKVPKCILIGTNKCAGVESPGRFFHQEALMNPHDKQQGNLPLRHADPWALIKL